MRGDVARALGAAFLGGDWSRAGLLERASVVVGKPRWLARVAREVLAAYHEPPVDRPRELQRFVEHVLARLQDEGVLEYLPRVRALPPIVPAMGRRRWPVPEIATRTDLAASLDLHVGELLWLADARGLERSVRDEKLRRYRYEWRARQGAPPRLIERPKRLLKDVQRRVLHEILDLIPPHETAHGFRRGHSVVTHARRHVGRRVGLRFDLESFFASIAGGRVYGIFRGAGYPEEVA